MYATWKVHVTSSILLLRRSRDTPSTRGVYGSRWMSGCHEEISNVRDDCQGDASFTSPGVHGLVHVYVCTMLNTNIGTIKNSVSTCSVGTLLHMYILPAPIGIGVDRGPAVYSRSRFVPPSPVAVCIIPINIYAFCPVCRRYIMYISSLTSSCPLVVASRFSHISVPHTRELRLAD